MVVYLGYMTVELSDLEKILGEGVKEYLSPLQANNLVLQFIIAGTDPISSDALKFLTRFLTPREYDELVEERTVLSRCGYPTCTFLLRDVRGNIRSPQNQTVLAWQHHFCQLSCYQASQFYREQLSNEPLVTRKNVAFCKFGDMHYEDEVLLLPEVQAVAKLNNKSVIETVTEMIKSQKLHERLQDLTLMHEEQLQDSSNIVSLAIKERN